MTLEEYDALVDDTLRFLQVIFMTELYPYRRSDWLSYLSPVVLASILGASLFIISSFFLQLLHIHVLQTGCDGNTF
jgi:hypothetical protein